MTQALLVRITCPTNDLAVQIADAAVERRLAACANIDSPVASTYIWKGVVEHAFEHVLWLKTAEACWQALEALVKQLHPYDVPAMIAVPCTHALDVYGDWLNETTKAVES